LTRERRFNYVESGVFMLKILPISEASNLAIHALATINLSGKKTRLSVTQLSEALDVSKSHLAKVMQKLVKAGLIDSIRGAKGGFSLIKNPKTITLFRVIKLVDGELKVEKCFFDHPRCEEGHCIISDLQEEVSLLLIEKLKSYTIKDIKVKILKLDDVLNHKK
jgi:Rrf2 family protein